MEGLVKLINLIGGLILGLLLAWFLLTIVYWVTLWLGADVIELYYQLFE